MNVTRLSIFLFLSLSPMQMVGADELCKLPLDDKTELLKGRLVVDMPRGAKTEARGFGIMSAPQPDEGETRVVVSDGKEKLVLMATDLHAFVGDDFSYNVSRLLLRWKKLGIAKLTRSTQIMKSAS